MNLNDVKEYYDSLNPDELSELQDEGAFFIYPSINLGYSTSPHGYEAFLSTGGDGVHYNIPEGKEDGLVVMAVPMNFDNPNMILGGNLHEFFSLGCCYGYFCLEQLTYQFEDTVKEIDSVKTRSLALEKLSEAFGLHPWSNVRDRLLELNKCGVPTTSKII